MAEKKTTLIISRIRCLKSSSGLCVPVIVDNKKSETMFFKQQLKISSNIILFIGRRFKKLSQVIRWLNFASVSSLCILNVSTSWRSLMVT